MGENTHIGSDAPIMAIIDGPIDRSIRQSRMMRCMLPRGYARYRTSEALWKQINSTDLAASVEVQATIASALSPAIDLPCESMKRLDGPS